MWRTFFRLYKPRRALDCLCRCSGCLSALFDRNRPVRFLFHDRLGTFTVWQRIHPLSTCPPLSHREAFAAWLPLGGVPLSYAVAIGYVLVDTADKGVKAFQMAQQELGANAALHPEVDTPRCADPETNPLRLHTCFGSCACSACLGPCVREHVQWLHTRFPDSTPASEAVRAAPAWGLVSDRMSNGFVRVFLIAGPGDGHGKCECLPMVLAWLLQSIAGGRRAVCFCLMLVPE